LGFGLQEIFANFVAGIILLFERPIRLGDVVTVGDISGKVTQIRIRATTIQQFNNRELLVPNKEFITSQLVNWTLKDSILRFEIPVGIAYGSDTKKAASVLQKILSEHPDVMDEPKPDVLFVNFGNSTLDFNVRGFVASVEHFVTAKSDLHYLIDDAFREAGIEIAFPQQDLHIRSLPEGGFNKLPS
jgi:potassium efflux system protein